MFVIGASSIYKDVTNSFLSLTSPQGIAGKTIHSSIHKSSFSGQTATKAVFDAQDALPNFEIGHAKVSKTRTLNAFLHNEVVYLDSPGLEDTRGAEMDIATAALLSQVAKKCKSIRFVVLIHCASLLEDRGNAFRSVLQFANKFVTDFTDYRTSFMFLFTHSHEITSMSSSSGDAKERIQAEIVQIAASTKDDKLLAVLDFVRKSLKRRYPFADVLLPLGTDYHALANVVEQKLGGLTDLKSASSCNLTLSSEMKLEVAVQNLLERLQAVIKSSPSDASEAKEIILTLKYLGDYIDAASVRKAAVQCDEIMSVHKIELKKCISEEFSRWLSSTVEFQEANASSLHDTLIKLQDIDASFSSKQWIQSKLKDVMRLKVEILEKASSSHHFDKEVRKMHVLASVFKQFESIYVDTCQSLMAILKETISVVSKTDLSTLNEWSGASAVDFIDKLLILQAMADFSETPVREINVGEACLIQERILKDVQTSFECWKLTAEKMSEGRDSNMTDFTYLASSALVLESMKNRLAKNEIVIDSLESAIGSTLHCLERDLVGTFKSCTDNLLNSSFDPSWESTLYWMKDTCKKFSNIQSGRWHEIGSLYSTVIGKIKSILESASELETMAQVTKVS